MRNAPSPITIEQITDEQAIADAQSRREQFDRNFSWFEAHAQELFAQHAGKCVCVAGAEAFAAETPTEAISLATAAHPDDAGWFVQYIPNETMRRVYAN